MVVACRKPSDLGYPDDGYVLPPLRMIPAVYEVDTINAGLSLFPVEAVTLDDADVQDKLPLRIAAGWLPILSLKSRTSSGYFGVG